MGTDAACIKAVLGNGGDVRLLPVHVLQPNVAAFETVLDAVLEFDGLLFTGRNDDLVAQEDHPEMAQHISLFDWWGMLMALIARHTLPPLFAVGTGAASVNIALGGTMWQDRAGPQDRSADASIGNRERHALELDPARLTPCARGINRSFAGDDSLPAPENNTDVVSCTHTHVIETFAPGLLAWGWHDSSIKGFGYPGPVPWFAIATLFHLEVRQQSSVSRSLFSRYMLACRAYAASLRDVLKSTRMRDKILRALSFEPLALRFFAYPFLTAAESCAV